DVEVDDETGEVVVVKMVQVYDVGRAINPTLVEGQIEGGAIMGLGLGLTEASYPHYPSPEHRGGEFGAYLGPAMEDLPELDNVILRSDDETGEVVVVKMVQVYDVGRAINPTLVEGQIEGGAIMGLGLGLTEASYPHYPSPEHRGGEFGAYLGPAMEDLPELDNVIL